MLNADEIVDILREYSGKYCVFCSRYVDKVEYSSVSTYGRSENPSNFSVYCANTYYHWSIPKSALKSKIIFFNFLNRHFKKLNGKLGKLLYK